MRTKRSHRGLLSDRDILWPVHCAILAVVLAVSVQPVHTQGTGARTTLVFDRGAYCIGESWKLNIVNAPVGASIRLEGVLDDSPWSLPEWGITDQDGRYSASGTFVGGNQGAYQLYSVISGIPSNTVFVSVSDCNVWAPANSDLADRNIKALAVDPLDSYIVYAGTEAHGVFKSTNAGVDWLPTGLNDAKVNVLVLDSSHPGTIYAGTDGRGLLKSTDRGATWSTVGPNIPNVSLLTIDPRNSSTLVAGYCNLSVGVMFRSTDGGGSWTKIVLPSPWTQFIAIGQRNPDVMYLTDYGKLGMDDVGYLWKSNDGGKTWSSTYLHDIGGIWHIVVDPTESDTLYGYGYGGSGYRDSWKSLDGGRTWMSTSLPIDAVVADPVIAGTLYAVVGGAVHRSTDSGGTWSDLPVIIAEEAQALGVSGSNPEMVFVGTHAGGVFKGVFTNLAGPTLTLDRIAYCSNESWKLNIVNAPASASIRLAGVLDGNPWSLPDWGITDQDGRYSASGTFVVGDKGTYQLYSVISGIPSNTVFVSVADCSGQGFWDY